MKANTSIKNIHLTGLNGSNLRSCGDKTYKSCAVSVCSPLLAFTCFYVCVWRSYTPRSALIFSAMLAGVSA